MKKRIFTFILAAVLAAATLSGCVEDSSTESVSDASTSSDQEQASDGGHVHAPAEEGVFERTNGINHYFTCKDCKESVGEKHVYEYSGDVNGHIKTCVCGKTQGERKDHIFDKGKCTKCGWENDPAHTHEFTLVGLVDNGYHNVECKDCGRKEKQQHNLVVGLDNDEHYHSCACGYRSENFPHNWYEKDKCAHCEEMGIFGHECEYNKISYDSLNHYKECECGKKTEIEGHNFDGAQYTYDNSTHSRKCNNCDYEEKDAHLLDSGLFLIDRCVTCKFELPISTGLEFELNGSGYTVIGIGSCKDKHVVIPDTYNGKPVTAIGSSAFEGNTTIVYVKLPDGVKDIGSSAFAGCTSLKAVNIPDGVTVVRESTFMGCASLAAVECKNVSKIEASAFYGCAALKGFYRDFRVETLFDFWFYDVGDYAFYNCRSLSFALEFGGDTHIGVGAFSGCSSIVSVEMQAPNEITLSGDAFSGCTSLKTVTIWNANTGYLDIGTFSGCTSLEKFRLGYGQLEDYLPFFADSVADEETGLSWYAGCPDFTVEIIDSPFESGVDVVVASMKISEIYEYVDKNN